MKDLVSLVTAADEIVNRSFAAPVPSILFHYTTTDTAIKILSTRTMLATAHDYTNDEAELVAVDDTTRQVAESYLAHSNRAAREIIRKFLIGYEKLKVSEFVPTFLLCFTTARDDSRLWFSEYADQGRGVCLGLKILDEEEPINAGLASVTIKVDYSEQSWEDRLRTRIGELLNLLEKNEPRRPALDKVLSSLFRLAAFAAVAGKQSKWEHEQEFRVVAFSIDQSRTVVEKRECRGQVKRSVRLLLRTENKLLALSEIILGPRFDELTIRELETALAQSGYPSADAEMPAITRAKN